MCGLSFLVYSGALKDIACPEINSASLVYICYIVKFILNCITEYYFAMFVTYENYRCLHMIFTLV